VEKGERASRELRIVRRESILKAYIIPKITYLMRDHIPDHPHPKKTSTRWPARKLENGARMGRGVKERDERKEAYIPGDGKRSGGNTAYR
jgi:hypothetical protein